MISASSALLLGLLTFVAGQSTDTKFAEYILAPTSRIIKPLRINQVNGTVERPESLLSSSAPGRSTSFQGPVAYVTNDFGKNVAGWVNFAAENLASDVDLTVTFTESSLY